MATREGDRHDDLVIKRLNGGPSFDVTRPVDVASCEVVCKPAFAPVHQREKKHGLSWRALDRRGLFELVDRLAQELAAEDGWRLDGHLDAMTPAAVLVHLFAL
jgi:hypothetical protein